MSISASGQGVMLPAAPGTVPLPAGPLGVTTDGIDGVRHGPPLVYTALGNVPESLLAESCEWSGDETSVTCAVVHRLRATGEVVKRSVHVYARKSLGVAVEQGAFGG